MCSPCHVSWPGAEQWLPPDQLHSSPPLDTWAGAWHSQSSHDEQPSAEQSCHWSQSHLGQPVCISPKNFPNILERMGNINEFQKWEKYTGAWVTVIAEQDLHTAGVVAQHCVHQRCPAKPVSEINITEVTTGQSLESISVSSDSSSVQHWHCSGLWTITRPCWRWTCAPSNLGENNRRNTGWVFSGHPVDHLIFSPESTLECLMLSSARMETNVIETWMLESTLEWEERWWSWSYHEDISGLHHHLGQHDQHGHHQQRSLIAGGETWTWCLQSWWPVTTLQWSGKCWVVVSRKQCCSVSLTITNPVF